LNKKIFLDYDEIVETALRNVVKESLNIISKKGLKDDHYFYISFYADYEGVIVPKELIKNNEKEIKIILQHQFWDLFVDDFKFSVVLSFNGKKKNIIVPYNAISSFSDPSVGFGLQFKNNNEDEIPEVNNEIIYPEKNQDIKKQNAEILSLDAFRSKNLDP